jgi:hypothetical protein
VNVPPTIGQKIGVPVVPGSTSNSCSKCASWKKTTEARFQEEYNVWLSDEPLTNDEICELMRVVERDRKQEGKPPLVQFLPRSSCPKKTPKKIEGVHSSHKLRGSPTPASRVESTVPEEAHAEEEKT